MVSNGDLDLAITSTDCHRFNSRTTARTAHSDQPSVPLKEKPASNSLRSHQHCPPTGIQPDCSNFTWLSLCGPQALAQELTRAGGSEEGGNSQPTSPNASNQPSTAKESTWQVSPTIPQSFSTLQMPTHHSWPHLSSVSAGKEGIMWVKRTPVIHTQSLLKREGLTELWAKHTFNFISGQSDLNEMKPEPASTTRTLKRPKGIQDSLLQL